MKKSLFFLSALRSPLFALTYSLTLEKSLTEGGDHTTDLIEFHQEQFWSIGEDLFVCENDQDIGGFKCRPAGKIQELSKFRIRKTTGSLRDIVGDTEYGRSELFRPSELLVLFQCVRNFEQCRTDSG